MTPPLTVVSDFSDPRPTGAEGSVLNIADRVRRLQAEAQGLAREHIAALQASIVAVERLAAEVAVGGEAYPVGVREIARRLAEDCAVRVQTIATLTGRS